jgi:uncharacterized protein (TIRG00374 family)
VARDDGSASSLDPRRLRTGLMVAVGIGVTVGLVVAFATGGAAVIAGISKLPLGWLLAALALSVGSWFGQGIGFAALTERGVGGNILRMTRAFLGGDFPALVSPFGSGGIPGGVFCLTREGLSVGEATAIITMHSLLTGAFFVIVGIAAAILLPLHSAGSSAIVWAGLAGILVAVVAIVWVALQPRKAAVALRRLLSVGLFARLLGADRASRLVAAAEREADQFTKSVRLLTRERPASLALSFAGLFSSRIFLVVTLPVIMYGLGWRGDIAPLLATAVGAMALAVASPTPGGSGAVEAALTALLLTQTTAPMAAAATLLWRGITYYTELIAGWAAFSSYIPTKGKAKSTD